MQKILQTRNKKGTPKRITEKEKTNKLIRKSRHPYSCIYIHRSSLFDHKVVGIPAFNPPVYLLLPSPPLDIPASSSLTSLTLPDVPAPARS